MLVQAGVKSAVAKKKVDLSSSGQSVGEDDDDDDDDGGLSDGEEGGGGCFSVCWLLFWRLHLKSSMWVKGGSGGDDPASDDMAEFASVPLSAPFKRDTEAVQVHHCAGVLPSPSIV